MINDLNMHLFNARFFPIILRSLIYLLLFIIIILLFIQFIIILLLFIYFIIISITIY